MQSDLFQYLIPLSHYFPLLRHKYSNKKFIELGTQFVDSSADYCTYFPPLVITVACLRPMTTMGTITTKKTIMMAIDSAITLT